MITNTKSALMSDTLKGAERCATRSSAPILITGESGTGKSTLAEQIHIWTARKGQFIVVECSSINENLIESRLFGHKKGAFTGATENVTGAFESAHKGTIFLDEIGDLPLASQGKLLRAVEHGIVCRVGCSRDVRVDVRIVAATHRNLSEMVVKGTFRQDLFFRLSQLCVEMPPLRQRREDIPHIVDSLLAGRELEPGVREIFEFGLWPGNIRQLKTYIERAYIHLWSEAQALEELAALSATTPQFPIAAAKTNELQNMPKKATRLQFARALSASGWWTSSDLAQAAGVSVRTARGDLAAWLKDGEVQRRGHFSDARYCATSGNSAAIQRQHAAELPLNCQGESEP